MDKPKKQKKPKEITKKDEEEEDEQIDYLNFPKVQGQKANTTLIALGLAALIAAVYISTLFPNVPGGDSGELIIAAYQMGIAHPPGYPLFTILGKFFTYIPYGSPAWRVNLMSAMCGVLSAVFMFLTVSKWSGSHVAGYLSATMFAFSPLVWAYTIQAEVFSLNNLIVNALIYLVVFADHLSARREAKFLLAAHLGALVCGFGVSNQHTIVFLFVPIILWIFFISGRLKLFSSARYRPKRWMSLLVFVLLGLSPYIHLYISPRIHQEKYSWGDTSTIDGFIHHFLRREYGTFQLYSGNIADQSKWIERVTLYFTRLAGEILYVGIPLAAVGLWVSLRGAKRNFASVGFLLAFCFLLYVIVFYSLTNLPLHLPLHLGVMLRFFMQPNAIMCTWMGLGFAFLEKKWMSRETSTLPWILVILLSGTQLALRYSAIDQHDNMYVYHYGRAILDPLPKNAILLAGGDLQTNIPYYLQLCEGVRPDVSILSIETMSWDWYNSRQGILYPNITFPGYVYHPFKKGAYSMKQFLDANHKKFPMFIAGEWKVGDPTVQSSYTTVPYGLVGAIHPISYIVNPWEEAKKSEKAMKHLNLHKWKPPPIAKFGPETWEYMIRGNFWEAANLFLAPGFNKETKEAEKYVEEGIKYLKFVRENSDQPSMWTLKYLGASYDHLRYWHPKDKDIINKVIEIWSEYLERSNVNIDPEFNTITDAVSRLRHFR